VTLPIGTTTLQVETTDTEGTTNLTAASVEITRVDPLLAWPSQITYDAAGERAFVWDSGTKKIVEIDVTTGRRTTVSESIPILFGLHWSATRGQLLYAGVHTIYALNPTTGSVTVISDNSIASPIDFGTIQDVCFTAASAYVADSTRAAILHVNLATGVRSEASGPSVGVGPEFVDPTGVRWLDTGVLFVKHSPPSGVEVLAVPVVGGNRAVFHTPSGAMYGFTTEPGGIVYSSLDSLVRVASGEVTSIFDGRRPALFSLAASIVALGTDRYLLVANSLDAVLDVDTSASDVTVISRSELREGDPIYRPRHMARRGDSIFLVDVSPGDTTQNDLDVIDLSTRTRTPIAGVGAGTDSFHQSVTGLYVNTGATKAYVTVAGATPSLIEVDLLDGSQSVVRATMAGASLYGITGLTVDEATSTAYVLRGLPSNELLSIDLETGGFSVIGTVSGGTCTDAWFDGPASRVLLTCEGGVVAVDPSTAEVSPVATTPYYLGEITAAPSGFPIFARSSGSIHVVNEALTVEQLGTPPGLSVAGFAGMVYDEATESLTLLGPVHNSIIVLDVPTDQRVIVYR
jgi:hypothetical protein